MVHLAMAHGRPQRPLFDYVIIVLFKPTKEVEILYQFPDKQTDDKLIASVPLFCFPDKEAINVESATFANAEESFSFALTGNDGERKLGYCRRIIAKPIMCFCVVSVLQSFDLFKNILTKTVERFESKNTNSVTELLKAIYEKPFPLLGETFSVKVTNPFTQCPEAVQFTYDNDSQLEFVDLQSLLQHMSPEVLLTIFAFLLIERRVIFYSENVTTLSGCVQAMVALLFPLHWQHIYVPVLPPSLLYYCCAPMPFIVGVLKSCVDEVQRLPMDEVLLVDLDCGKLYMTNADNAEHILLPQNVLSLLVKPLRKMQSTIKKHNNNVNISTKVKEKIKREKKKLLDVFQSFFVSLLAFYRSHIRTDGDYDKEGFVAARQPEMKDFFTALVCTQMFERFIEERAYRNPAFNEFEKTLEILESTYREPNQKIPKAYQEILKYDWDFLVSPPSDIS